MHLAASRTLSTDARRHYQREMLEIADITLGKCAVDIYVDLCHFHVTEFITLILVRLRSGMRVHH